LRVPGWHYTPWGKEATPVSLASGWFVIAPPTISKSRTFPHNIPRISEVANGNFGAPKASRLFFVM